MSDEAVVGSFALVALACLTRWRTQWRAYLFLLGTGEAITATLNLVNSLVEKDRLVDERKELDGDGDGDNEDDTNLRHEAQHVLSFWILFASLSLLESLRTSSHPARSTGARRRGISTRLFDSFRTIRSTYVRFLRLWIIPLYYRSRYAYLSMIRNHPRLDVSTRFPRFPSFAFATRYAHVLAPRSLYDPSRTVRLPSTFPQPSPALFDAHRSDTLPLPHAYFAPSRRSRLDAAGRFSAELRWELVKLLVLWTGSRRDGFGAKSVVWDWILGPLVRKWSRSDRRDRSFDGRGSDGGAKETVDIPQHAKRGRTRVQSEDDRGSRAAQGGEGGDALARVGEEGGGVSTPVSSSPERLPRHESIWMYRTPPANDDATRARRRATSPYPPFTLPDSTLNVAPSPRLGLDHDSSSRGPPPPSIHGSRSSRTVSTPATTATSVSGSVSSLDDAFAVDGERRRGHDKRKKGIRGRDSLLMESPPTCLVLDEDEELKTGTSRFSNYRRNCASPNAASEERDEGTGFAVGSEEAQEGIARWATSMTLKGGAASLDLDTFDLVDDQGERERWS